MIDEKTTMSDALLSDMFHQKVDVNSVFDMCDYLESRLGDLNKVEYFMDIATGRAPDQYLKRN